MNTDNRTVFDRLEAYEEYAERYETERPLTFNPADIIREANADLRVSLEQQERDAARADCNARECSEVRAALKALVHACTPLQTHGGYIFGVRMPDRSAVEAARTVLARDYPSNKPSDQPR